MDVSIVNKYIEARKQRAELEKLVVKISRRLGECNRELAKIQSEEDSLGTFVNQDSLVTQKSVKIINSVLGDAVQLVLGQPHIPLNFRRVGSKEWRTGH